MAVAVDQAMTVAVDQAMAVAVDQAMAVAVDQAMDEAEVRGVNEKQCAWGGGRGQPQGRRKEKASVHAAVLCTPPATATQNSPGDQPPDDTCY